MLLYPNSFTRQHVLQQGLVLPPCCCCRMSRERRAVFEYGLLLAQSLEQQQRDAQAGTDKPSADSSEGETDEGSDSDFVKVEKVFEHEEAVASMFGGMAGAPPAPVMLPMAAPMAAPPPAPGGLAFGATTSAAPRVSHALLP